MLIIPILLIVPKTVVATDGIRFGLWRYKNLLYRFFRACAPFCGRFRGIVISVLITLREKNLDMRRLLITLNRQRFPAMPCAASGMKREPCESRGLYP